MTADDLPVDARLLDMIARELGHDWLLLMSGSWPGEKKWCRAVFGNYDDYGTEPLEADGRQVWLKSADAAGRLRSNEDMYHELVLNCCTRL